MTYANLKTGAKPNILAIDDTPENLLTLGSALGSEFRLQIATSGAMGLALAEAAPPDLILLDVMMPEMDGYETCRRFKADPRLRSIPVIFATALGDSVAESAGLALGAADYITKPINVEIARQRIRNLLERERLRKEVEDQRDHLQELVQALNKSEARNRAVTQSAHDGIITSGSEGNILGWNHGAETIFGYAEPEIMGKPMTLLMPEHYRSAHIAGMNRIRSSGETHVIGKTVELSGLRKNGSEFPLELSLAKWEIDDGWFLTGIIRDITERKQLEDQVRQLAFYDTLTELANRRLLNDRLRQSIAASRRNERYGALMFLDLDNFKSLNDTHGHEAGDLLLIEAATRLKSCVRAVDTVARFGGDEFVVMINELNADKSESATQGGVIAEKIRAALAKPYVLQVRHEGTAQTTVEHQCTASIGVALFGKDDSSQEDVLKRADTAMYQAKEAGRNLIRFYDAADT